MEQRGTLPAYDDLPRNDRGVATAWGIFGPDDSAGMLGQLDERHARAALGLARRGAVFALDAPLDFFDPPLFGRPPLRRDVQIRDDWAANEVLHDFNPQCSSQWDALAHVAYEPDAFYNGATAAEVANGSRNTIEHWARRGIVGRGVLLDLERSAQAAGATYDPGTSHAFSVADLEAARKRAGVELRHGDILILRTGFVDWYTRQEAEDRTRIASRDELRACGIEHTEAMAEYLWNHHVAAVAADCPSVEVWPMDHAPGSWPFGCLHQILLGQFGVALGELWCLEDLAEDCAHDGIHEFLLTSAPLNAPGSFGSPANALAIK